MPILGQSDSLSGAASERKESFLRMKMKIALQYREQARRVYYGAVFEAKKEIRTQLLERRFPCPFI